MFNGTRVKSTEEFHRLIAEGKTLDGVGTVEVHAGDYVYVTGGTLHAAAAGSLSFEIEENCDYTYRFYDFDRVDKNGNKRPAGIALMDVDDFKICNDTYGHYAGDMALKTVANAIQSCIRKSDQLQRFRSWSFRSRIRLRSGRPYFGRASA